MSVVTVIIGGGIGGFTVAKELRELQPEALIKIIDPEGTPYDRPPLSKEVLAGTRDFSDLGFIAQEWFQDNSVEVLEDLVIQINGDQKTVTTRGGEKFSYDNLVFAVGGEPRRGATTGFDNEVMVLRTKDDTQRLKDACVPGRHIGIIGAGLIGAEVASTVRSLGGDVTLIDPMPVSLIPAVGEEIAHRLHDLHQEHGVEFIQGMTSGVESVGNKKRISIDGHDDVVVDEVLLCIGITPNEALAKSIGLECDNGILVDEEQRTNHESIWAVGDCARLRKSDGTLERRHEHWDSALQEGRAAAYSIASKPAPGRSAPWFWSDRYGVHVEGTGSMTEEGTTYLRPDAEGRPEVAFRVSKDNKLLGAAAYSNSMAIRAARRMIDREIVVDPEKLVDPTVHLKKLAR